MRTMIRPGSELRIPDRISRPTPVDYMALTANYPTQSHLLRLRLTKRGDAGKAATRESEIRFDTVEDN